MAQVIAITASPILTRLYKPSDFGTLQVFVSVIGLILMAATGRYDVAVLLPEDEQSSIDVLALATLCVGISTTIVAGVAIICHYRWILPASLLALKGYLWLLPLSVLGAGVYQVLSFWAMRRERYKQIATTKFVQVGFQIGTQLGVGFATHGSIGLLLGDSVGRIMGSGRFLRDLWREYRNQLCAIRLSRMLKLAIRYREYPLVSMWGSLINYSGLALPALFLAQYYGAQPTGWLALVNRVLGVPSALIGTSISQVYIAEAAKLSRSDPRRLKYIFLKTTRRMLFLGITPCVAFMILAPWAFQTIFGNAWREAGEYARYFAPMFYVSFINSPVIMTLNVLERQRLQFGWDASRLVLTVASIALPYHFGCGSRIAILCYGAAMSLMYAIHWTLSYYAIDYCARHATIAELTSIAKA